MKQNKLILVLVGIIVVAALFLVLKAGGMIKPTVSKEEAVSNTQLEAKRETEANLAKTVEEDTLESNRESSKRLDFVVMLLVAVMILVIYVFIFGQSRFYLKLGLPRWVVILYFLAPILNYLIGIVSKGIPFPFLSQIVTIVFGLIISWYYFEGVEMPGYFAVICLIPIVGWVFALIFLIWSNIRIAKMFNKGIPYTIALVFLPFIFQPILGYSQEEPTTLS